MSGDIREEVEAMIKILGGIFLGVFVGAVVITVIDKKHPKLLKNTKKKITNGLTALKGAFMQGYTETANS